jgi:SDR family mycofactocin-dependent oxidoreductase
MTSRFAGKVVFITGVARGQGRNHAVRFAQEGAAVIGLDICADVASASSGQATRGDLAETERLIEAAGGKHYLQVADVRDYNAVRTIVSEGVDRFGRLDVAVANAGIASTAAAPDMSADQWREMIDINLTGAWFTAQAAIGPIRGGGGGGSIIFTSSFCGLAPVPNMVHYNAAKHGLQGIAKTLALELGPERIRVNTINPTNVDTAMIQNDFVRHLFMPDVEHPTRADAEAPNSPYTSMTVLGIPWVDVNDISEAVMFLASDAARYITGIALPVDGGQLIKTY